MLFSLLSLYLTCFVLVWYDTDTDSDTDSDPDVNIDTDANGIQSGYCVFFLCA